jgi:hypothetical protein
MLGTNCVPNSFWQAFDWLHSFMPWGEKFYMVGISVCVLGVMECKEQS